MQRCNLPFTNITRRQPGRAYSRYESRKQVCRASHGEPRSARRTPRRPPTPSERPARRAVRCTGTSRQSPTGRVLRRVYHLALHTPRASLSTLVRQNPAATELIVKLYPNWIYVFDDYDHSWFCELSEQNSALLREPVHLVRGRLCAGARACAF